MFRRTVISVLAAQKHIEVVDDDEAIDLSDNAIVFFFWPLPVQLIGNWKESIWNQNKLNTLPRVVVEPTHLKNMLVKLDHLSK